MDSSKKLSNTGSSPDRNKKQRKKRKNTGSPKSVENKKLFSKKSSKSSDYKSVGSISPQFSSQKISEEKKQRIPLQKDIINKDKSQPLKKQKISNAYAKITHTDDKISQFSSESKGKENVFHSISSSSSLITDYNSAFYSYKSKVSQRSYSSGEQECSFTKNNVKKTNSNPIRDRFRIFFRKISPMYAGKIKILTVKDQSVLQWAGSWDYRFFVCAGLVGLGNLTYFPLRFLHYGDFHFFSAYIILMVVVAYPMILMEAGLGQFCSQGPGGCWEFGKLFKGLGYVFIVWTGLHNVTFYQLAMEALTSQYESMFMYPWENPLNTDVYNKSELKTFENHTNSEILRDDPIIQEKSPDTLKKTLLYTFNWITVVVLLIPNIRQRGYIITRLFIIVAVSFSLFFLRGLFLPGAVTGIKYGLAYRSGLTLMNYEVWLAAFRQCFLSLNLFPGLHMTLSKYNHFNNQICFDVMFFILVDFFFSIAGFITMFSYIGSLAQTTSFRLKDIRKLTSRSVVTEKLPYVLSGLELGYAWAMLYYIISYILLHLNLTTLFEVIVTGIVDTFKIDLRDNKRRYVVLGVSGAGFFFLIADTFDATYVDNVVIIVEYYAGIYVSAAISLSFLGSVLYVIGVDRFLSMLECSVGWYATPMLSSPWWKRWWKCCWACMPLIYLLLLSFQIFEGKTEQRETWQPWMVMAGRSLWVFSALTIFGTMVYLITTTDRGGFCSRISFLTTPTPEWGPVLPQNRYIMQIGEQDRLKEIELRKVKRKSIKYFSQLRMSF